MAEINKNSTKIKINRQRKETKKKKKIDRQIRRTTVTANAIKRWRRIVARSIVQQSLTTTTTTTPRSRPLLDPQITTDRSTIATYFAQGTAKNAPPPSTSRASSSRTSSTIVSARPTSNRGAQKCRNRAEAIRWSINAVVPAFNRTARGQTAAAGQHRQVGDNWVIGLFRSMGIRVGGVFSSFDNNNRSEREFFDLSLDFILKFAAMINFDG